MRMGRRWRSCWDRWWGDYLPQEQLDYLLQLLQQLYIQGQSQQILIPLKDFSEHLLED